MRLSRLRSSLLAGAVGLDLVRHQHEAVVAGGAEVAQVADHHRLGGHPRQPVQHDLAESPAREPGDGAVGPPLPLDRRVLADTPRAIATGWAACLV